MYHKKLSIVVFSKNQTFIEFLRAVEPLANCTHDFLPEQTDFSGDLCADADIVILDLPPEETPLTVRESCLRPGARIVLCDRSLDESVDQSGLLEQVDALWIAPLTKDRVGFYFGRLLQEVVQYKELWLHKQILRTLMDSVPDLIWIKDVKGAHLRVNRSFCELVGKTKEQCYNRGHYYIWDIEPDEYSKGEYVCLESEEQVMNAKKTCYFAEKIKGPDNRMLQFGTYKSPVFDERGNLLGTMGTARNVTDWRNTNAKVAIILDTLNAAAIILNEEGNILLVNRAWRELFHQNADMVVGTAYASWKQAVFQQKPVLQHGKHTTLTYQGKDGAVHLELAEEPMLDIFGQIIGYFCLFHDMTEHEKHMALSQKYQRELEEEVRMKTRTIRYIQQKAYVSFADIINSRDPSTADHLRNTSWLAEILLEELKRENRHPKLADEEYCDVVLRAVSLHDIGKIILPDAVLRKKGKYTTDEYQAMMKHTTEGKKIIDRTIGQIESFKFYKTASEMALSHHERWDGQGYPTGLSGKDIPLSARIMAVVDVFDALISPRSYHPTKSVDQAYIVIKAVAGTQLDPELAAAFIIARPAVEKLVREKIYRM